MNCFYKIFSEIDNVYWTNYFLNEFIPKNLFFEKQNDADSSYILYPKKTVIENLEILKLSALLSSKLKFPPIDYFLIFKHTKSQPIHIDSYPNIRNVSFNLPLTGYKGTDMCFYSLKSDAVAEVRDSYYFKNDDTNLVSKFAGTNEWVLVNTSVPHNIVNIDSNNPRLTVCLRFADNPKFEDLIARKKEFNSSLEHQKYF